MSTSILCDRQECEHLQPMGCEMTTLRLTSLAWLLNGDPALPLLCCPAYKPRAQAQEGAAS